MDGTTGTTGERPTTFAQAFASEGTVAESPTAPDTTTPDTTAAAPIEQPASVDTTPAQGPIPYDRHKSILDGAYKERDTFKQQLEQLGWAQNLDRASVEEAARIGRLYQTDRVGYLRNVIAESLADADLAPLIRSEAARVLAGARGQQPEAPIEPDIPVYDGQGQLVSRTYSHEALAKIRARDREELKKELLGEIAPIKQTFEKQQAAEKQREQQRQTEARIDSIYERAAAKFPQFKEHDVEIAQAMQNYPDADPAEQVALAWAEVVLPKLQASHEAKALESLKTKAAAASGSVNPSGAAIASTKRPSSFHDPSLQWR